MKKLFVLFLVGCLILFSVFLMNWEVTIDTTGIPDEIEYGETISQPVAKLTGKYIFKNGFEIELKDENHNDFSKTGTYHNFYEASYLFYKGAVSKEIKVVDKKSPEIKLNYIDGHYTLPNAEYIEEGYTAFDEYDGDISDKVERFVENNIVTYVVADSSGNTVSIERDIYYNDPIPPEIKLNGNSEITLYQNSKYEEPGVTVTDNCDQNIADKVVINGTVDTGKVGTYTLEYVVQDNYGNEAKITRTVNIIQQPIDKLPVAPGKVIYLTFDDGPSTHTRRLLDVLDKYNVKATFFVVGNKGHNEILKEIVNRGHSIGIHSVTHTYSEIYASEEAFLNDLYTMQQIIEDETGIKTYLMRFPGGSSNTVSRRYCKGIMSKLTKKVEELGFRYFDWNVTSGDAGGATTKDDVYYNVLKGVLSCKNAVVLQHDTKGFSVDAVEDIIKWGLENDCIFAPLNMSSPTVHHGINN